MKTLNLFKSIKNISYLTAFACLPLSSACGTEPQEIIEAYAKDTDPCFKSGNVLAYKNIKGETVVLKSGSYFAYHNEPIEKDVKLVSLEEVLEYTAKNYDYKKNPKYQPSQSTLETFGDCCKTDNKDWYEYIKSKHPYSEAFPRKDPIEYIQTNGAETLHGRLGNFRHTEIQVQALWKKYNDIPQYGQEVIDRLKKEINKLRKKSKDIKKLLQTPGMVNAATEEQYKNYRTKELIKTLLPIALLETTDEKNRENHKIYSLFEACLACRQTEWLKGKDEKDKGKKDIFMFKVADGQVTKETIINKKTGKEESVRHKMKGNNFMSQKDLETKIEGFPKEDIGTQLTNNGFEKITQPKQVSSANSTGWE